MNAEQQAKTFFFKDRPVGYFEGDQLPDKPGEYRYMPFRSRGHYEFIGALKSKGPQRCHYLVEEKKRHFTVLHWVSYGLLVLGEFVSKNS
jgi:hypothetical protein